MSEYNFNYSDGNCGAVPIKAERIFDSCSDKDCFCHLPVTVCGCSIPDNINIVKSRAAAVEDICVNVEPVPFNKGFYSIDLTFTFSLEILGYENACCPPTVFRGMAYASKNCILYGSESSVKTFSSDKKHKPAPSEISSENLPTAKVSVLEPIVLETKTEPAKKPDGDAPKQPEPPQNIYVTLGLFSVVELSRPVMVLVPAYDYSIPKKECCAETDTPCEVFDRLKFPENEFIPAALSENEEEAADGEMKG